MKRNIALGFVVAGVVALAVTRAGGEDADAKVRLLEAENHLLRGQIEALKKEVAALKTTDTQAELASLRKELAESKATIAKLAKDAPASMPATVKRSGLRATGRDINPDTVRKTNFVGADMLLEGYVVDAKGEKESANALMLVGDSGTRPLPWGWGRVPKIENQNTSREKVIDAGYHYQIHVHFAGKAANRLTLDERVQRVRGIVAKIEVKDGNLYELVGRNPNPERKGKIILIELIEAAMQ